MKNVISYILFFSILLLCACSSDDAPSSDAGLSCSDVLGNYSSQNEFSSNQQSMEFDYCYPSDLIGEKFSLSNYSEKILLIEMSASWWGPCLNANSVGEEIYNEWLDNENVKIIHVLDEMGQPLSCEQWGDWDEVGIPSIIDGTSITDNSLFRDWFPSDPASGALYPLTVFINHEMQIEGIYHSSLAKEDVSFLINCMLDAM